MEGIAFSVIVVFGGLLIILGVMSFLSAMWHRFWHFMERKSIERDFMKLLKAGRDVEVMVHDHEKILGIPIVECMHRKSMRRNVKYYSYNEKIIFVNPVLKLVDGTVILVGGVVRRKNKPKRHISVETYLHYYDPPKPDVYRFDAKQGKYVLVPRKTSDQEQAE